MKLVYVLLGIILLGIFALEVFISVKVYNMDKAFNSLCLYGTSDCKQSEVAQ